MQNAGAPLQRKEERGLPLRSGMAHWAQSELCGSKEERGEEHIRLTLAALASTSGREAQRRGEKRARGACLAELSQTKLQRPHTPHVETPRHAVQAGRADEAGDPQLPWMHPEHHASGFELANHE